MSSDVYERILRQDEVVPLLVFSQTTNTQHVAILLKKFGDPWDMIADADEKELYVSFKEPLYGHDWGGLPYPVVRLNISHPNEKEIIHGEKYAGKAAAGLCFDPSENLVYLTLRNRDGILGMDTRTFTVNRVLNPKLQSPILVFCDRLNKRLVVGAEEGILRNISLKTGKITSTIKTAGNPVVFVPSKNEETLFVCQWVGEPLVVINLKTFSVGYKQSAQGQFPPPFPLGCALNETENEFYMIDFLTGFMNVLDASTFSIKRKFKIKRGLRGLAYDEKSKLLYAGDYNSGYVLVIRPENGKIVRKIFVGGGIRKIYITPKTKHIFAASRYGVFEILRKNNP